MYQIKCDDYVIYDPRDDAFIVQNPKCILEANTVGEASFSIFAKHPHYGHLQKLKSIFSILQDGKPIFRGRMTEDTRDFHNIKYVDLEGVLAFFNDSIIRPFVYPDDFLGVAEYITAAESGNVVEFFLGWLIDQHNEQTQPFQHFRLGNVTVSDPNNYLSRSSTDYLKTWEVLKSKLFDSALGGYLCIRYEEDGNYIDYLADFELTNIQPIKFGENLLDLSIESDASETYSAIIPLGKKKNEIDTGSDDNFRLTIAELADGDITDDIVKSGDTLYSKSAVERFGFIYAPPATTTWEDITEAVNLQTKGTEFMIQKATKLSNTITIKAVDLHFSDDEIEAFRIYRYIALESAPHDQEGRLKLTRLEIDILNPQNTVITIGDTVLSLTDINSGNKQNVLERVEVIQHQATEQTADITEIQSMMMEQSTSIVSTCEEIMLSVLQSYTEASNFESFQEAVQAQFQLLKDEMTLQFTETTQRIENVDGDLQMKFNQIIKYFTFEIDGMTIGQVDNPNKVVIDNDEISILVNGVVVQKFDASGKSLIPELNITRALNLFGYMINQDEEGRVNCEYAGGDG